MIDTVVWNSESRPCVDVKMRSTHLYNCFLIAVGTALILPGVVWAAPRSSNTDLPTVFVNVNVVPMNSNAILFGQTVVVRNGVISQIGPAQNTPIPQQANVVDGSGRFLMPGLTDAHIHLDALSHARPDFGDGPVFLLYGITSVVNLRGGPQQLEWRRRIQDGVLLGPNLYTAGEFINEPLENSPEEVRREVMRQKNAGYDVIKFHEIRNGRSVTTHGLSRPAYDEMNAIARSLSIPLIGHAPDLLGLQALLDNHQSLAHAGLLVPLYFFPRKGLLTFGLWSLTALGLMCFFTVTLFVAAAFRWLRERRVFYKPELVRSASLLGASLFIIVLWPGLGLLSGSLVFLIFLSILCLSVILLSGASVFECLRKWKSERTAGVFSLFALTVVVTASMAFGASLFYWVPIAWRASDPGIRRLAIKLRQAGISLEPTLVVYKTGSMILEGRSRDLLSDPVMSHIAPTLRDRWATIPKVKQPLQSRLVEFLFRRTLAVSERTTLALQKQGVPLILGTDTFGIPLCAPGKSAHDELKLLNDSGLTPYEVLRTATVNPAKFLRKDSEFGTVEVGKRADLLLLPANPLENLRALDDPLGVMIRGRWLTNAMLKQVIETTHYVTR